MTPDAVTVVLAHLGHWYIETPIYVGPIVAVVLWMRVHERRERRRARRGDRPG